MRLRITPNWTSGLTPFELMTGRMMQLPGSIITGGTDVGPLKDKIRRYILELSTQLNGMCKLNVQVEYVGINWKNM